MSGNYQVTGTNQQAPFTLKIHRGEGMSLLAMNWRNGRPPKNFVGFAVEYKEPGKSKFYALNNRLAFAGVKKEAKKLSTLLSPIQKFRWVHFPRKADIKGKFHYRVSPVFMDADGRLSYGEVQEAKIELHQHTYPNRLNVTFTRGFVSSQAFVDRYQTHGEISTLLPAKSHDGLKFKPKHPKTKEALEWMGFEARAEVLDLLDAAIKDKSAQVYVVAYDLSEATVVERLKKLGKRLQIIIDDSAEHGHKESGESQAARMLVRSAGKNNVKRQHMTKLQHNKTIVVDGKSVKRVVCGSTNFSWRGLYVQANNAIVLQGKSAVDIFKTAFDNYWHREDEFGKTESAEWMPLNIKGIDAQVSFSPHSAKNGLIDDIAADVDGAESSVFFSLAFLSQTPGPIRDSLKKAIKSELFVYGISDKKVGGIELQTPSGNRAPVTPGALAKDVPPPFSKEPTGGGGNRMHHKFIVLDFDKPTARVYMGSYNFSSSADKGNGENLLLIRDRRIATSYMVEALRIFDHYHFRLVRANAKIKRKSLDLAKPPTAAEEKPWWYDYYEDERKIRDRLLFS